MSPMTVQIIGSWSHVGTPRLIGASPLYISAQSFIWATGPVRPRGDLKLFELPGDRIITLQNAAWIIFGAAQRQQLCRRSIGQCWRLPAPLARGQNDRAQLCLSFKVNAYQG
jgi:hypothetical protein